jgi:hypothetical protein
VSSDVTLPNDDLIHMKKMLSKTSKETERFWFVMYVTDQHGIL